MNEKIIVGILSALASGVLTYAFKAASIEGRLEGIERAIVRIEAKLK
jgi:hypothetical protein